MNYKISLTGDLGSGKSTVSKIISDRIGSEIVSIGSIQRRMAKERGMTTYEFNHYMETHSEIDDEFDTMLKSYDAVNDRNLLFDSRLAWNFVPSAFSVYITTDLMEAARRVCNAKRDNEGYSNIEEAMSRLSERRASEIYRYFNLYGLKIKDLSNYNLIVDSTTATPDEVVDIILSECVKYFQGKREKVHFFSPNRLYPLANAKSEGGIEIIECNDFYFVTGGVEALKEEISKQASNVPCVLSNSDIADKVAYISQNCSIDYLKKWEKEAGVRLIRYPF
jgi:cytidylate kinase